MSVTMSFDSPYRSEQLVQLAETYARHKGVSLSRVSTIIRNDGKFFDSLKAGGDCKMRTFFETLGWFSSNWPRELRWPVNVSRPKARAGAAA